MTSGDVSCCEAKFIECARMGNIGKEPFQTGVLASASYLHCTCMDLELNFEAHSDRRSEDLSCRSEIKMTEFELCELDEEFLKRNSLVYLSSVVIVLRRHVNSSE